MAGGLLQIIAYGAQDVYLTSEPQITFFKIVYRKHTNFSIQAYEKTFTDNPDFGKRSSTKLYPLADLASKMFLKVVISKIQGINGMKFAWVRRLGHALLRSVEITIGGLRVDKQYGTWLDIWYELARQGNKETGYAKMIGDVDELTEYNDKTKPSYTLLIPLQFWFNRHYGLALPMISIFYHDIYINVEFEEKEKLLVRSSHFNNFKDIKILEADLITDYIYLDIDERKKFAENGHEYLVDILQFSGDEGVIDKVKRMILTFNFPTKELIWAMKNGNYLIGKKFLCYSNKDDWEPEIYDCTKRVLLESMIILKDCNSSSSESSSSNDYLPPPYGCWEEFKPNTICNLSDNGNLIISNYSCNYSLWINTNSLMVDDYNITGKIQATITLTEGNIIVIDEISTPLSERDISIPLDEITDTRLNKSHVHVIQFSNYGLYITGRINPIEYAMLEYNDVERVEKKNANFFGKLQPYIYHNNTPNDGINLYSFAINPEELQPSGTSNLSKVENIILTLWFGDSKNKENKLPNLNLFNLQNRLYIFAFSYNILRVMSGFAALVYSG